MDFPGKMPFLLGYGKNGTFPFVIILGLLLILSNLVSFGLL